MKQQASSELGQWLRERCEKEGLSFRRMATKTGLSHGTIGDIINGVRPTAETIGKLAHAFGGDGNRKLAVEDKLLILAGYRTERPEEEASEAMARLIDIQSGFSERQLRIMTRFADFLSEMEEK